MLFKIMIPVLSLFFTLNSYAGNPANPADFCVNEAIAAAKAQLKADAGVIDEDELGMTSVASEAPEDLSIDLISNDGDEYTVAVKVKTDGSCEVVGTPEIQ
jgi:hypothetical protein